MLELNKIHHIAIISSNYKRSKFFYTKLLGLTIKNEVYRADRDSYKLDLELNGEYIIELFSFPKPPARLSRPEATGLRHLAFEVKDVAQAVQQLEDNNIEVEPIRIDPYTHKKFAFFTDPDGLPIEIYEE
ncbi:MULTISPECIES: VOC family protein [unclassified Aureispira]|uniref:SMU1112c/YaeR family gloxylase I-like metalloprotein n=1 Tax=unclassified Aureispira TaxID=2649989 RepID=UPI000698E142|nr:MULTISPECIES: VOC family protein [unclassified Aureispira]WMX16628.1 VOC family protein [Aureispira sp. CCB-E]